ncbi:ABC transporter substrate-binding protein [Jiangella sp. DSM 45060]|uniref:ABC transporter substrate-binding protein n=1 Tax=Jiangella sp. DSM 45060 TaxID=1798224 RepID=UPI00087C5732|nr:sugar ABC transporter substrate-binding protein [Jiangella sp. DSM 45060]SDT59992.1 carbohydrate ABC transporter substrate-binding protein, CUT1 family [Jiangella sp. DSM 45060]
MAPPPGHPPGRRSGLPPGPGPTPASLTAEHPERPAGQPERPSRRRFLGLSAALTGAVAAPSLLGACGGTSTASGSEPLQFWNFYAPAPSEDPSLLARAAWMHDTVDRWNAENEQQIELVYAPVLGSEKLATAFSAGEGPDIFLISPGDIARYLNGNMLAELTPHLTREAVDDFFADNLATRMIGDKVYALPMEIEPLALYYSRPAFEAAGLSEGDLPAGWDDLVAVSDRLVSAGQGGLVFPTAQDYYQNFVWYPWMWQGGGEVIAGDGRSGFDSDGAVDALRLWKETVDLGITPRVPPASNDLVVAFSEGYASVWQSGIWSIQDFERKAPDFDYGVIPLPVANGGEPATVLGGWAFAANAKGRNPDEAARFCAWALGSTDDDGVARVADWCIDAKRDISPRRSSLEHGSRAGGYDHEFMRLFRDEIFPSGRGEPRYPPVIYKAVSDAIQSCQLAGGDPEDQAATAAQAIDAYLTTYEGVDLA